MSMDRVSSQLTIFLRIALPTIWLTTILSLMVLLASAVRGKAQVFSNPVVWLGFFFVLATGVSFIYFFLWHFYRVDMDERYVYVSDYFRTYKYSFSDIESIRPASWAPTRIFTIRLKSKGTFGRDIHFLASQKLWNDFIDEHPDVFKDLYENG